MLRKDILKSNLVNRDTGGLSEYHPAEYYRGHKNGCIRTALRYEVRDELKAHFNERESTTETESF